MRPVKRWSSRSLMDGYWVGDLWSGMRKWRMSSQNNHSGLSTSRCMTISIGKQTAEVVNGVDPPSCVFFRLSQKWFSFSPPPGEQTHKTALGDCYRCDDD
jgi:hypothetical protein